MSFVQISRIHLFKNYYIGTGLITVVGTSFATLSTANAVFNSMYADGSCPSTVSANGTIIRGPCPDAYGKILGSFSFRIFPLRVSYIDRNLPHLLIP